ncbi:TetR family transcriptional regulator [Streptomyces europaeiscabiei]|uniref:TetR/AcrR family transcriptional regulator n=1 Tax=Streptomyces europaeiscabiei TaxID=146819 RepID=UPI0029ACF9E7|nr:TetR family transcriptional regulator [Streptomyces europaeiscabiei]MDX3697919.1 TetR family transcriptional regulator [Streptomyces europaeiscabiei]
MSRVSQAQAIENRRRAVDAASQLFRERGVNGISVADLMKSIGLTTGGFYKQFPSKEALVAEAAQAAFGDLDLLLASFDTAHGDHATARGALVDFYLSTEHRDQPGTGCPNAGFAGDMAREPTAGEVRETYAAGVQEFAAWLSTDANDGLPMVATLVGAILLARATAGTELSEKILESTHKALTAPPGPRPGVLGTGTARRGLDAT